MHISSLLPGNRRCCALSQSKQHLPGEFLLPDAPHDNTCDNPYTPPTRTAAVGPASAGPELPSLPAVGMLQDRHRAVQMSHYSIISFPLGG